MGERGWLFFIIIHFVALHTDSGCDDVKKRKEGERMRLKSFADVSSSDRWRPGWADV